MRTGIGPRVVVKAQQAGVCIEEEDAQGPGFEYGEGHFGVLEFDWEWDEAHDAVAHITVIWDHDPQRNKRMVLLSHLLPIGLEIEQTRMLLTRKDLGL